MVQSALLYMVVRKDYSKVTFGQRRECSKGEWTVPVSGRSMLWIKGMGCEILSSLLEYYNDGREAWKNK